MALVFLKNVIVLGWLNRIAFWDVHFDEFFYFDFGFCWEDLKFCGFRFILGWCCDSLVRSFLDFGLLKLGVMVEVILFSYIVKDV